MASEEEIQRMDDWFAQFAKDHPDKPPIKREIIEWSLLSLGALALIGVGVAIQKGWL